MEETEQVCERMCRAGALGDPCAVPDLGGPGGTYTNCLWLLPLVGPTPNRPLIRGRLADLPQPLPHADLV